MRVDLRLDQGVGPIPAPRRGLLKRFLGATESEGLVIQGFGKDEESVSGKVPGTD